MEGLTANLHAHVRLHRHPNVPRSRSRSCLHYYRVDKILRASPEKGTTQEQRTSTHHTIRFNFSRSRAYAHIPTRQYA